MKNEKTIHDPAFSQPLCTALQIGLVELLKNMGVTPAAVLGHSSGEIAAA
jgi:malonyl CoA-acyl carrier protein transacylase